MVEVPLVVHYWTDLQSVHAKYQRVLVLALCLVRSCFTARQVDKKILKDETVSDRLRSTAYHFKILPG